jgi:hypothetical protein
MAAGRSAAEPGRLLAGRAGHLPAAAVLAGSRHAGEDLLAVAGPAKAAKWPVPERPIPPAGGQSAGARQARRGPRVRVSSGWSASAGTHTELARGAGASSRPVPVMSPDAADPGVRRCRCTCPEGSWRSRWCPR